jgi:hypothetical protein
MREAQIKSLQILDGAQETAARYLKQATETIESPTDLLLAGILTCLLASVESEQIERRDYFERVDNVTAHQHAVRQAAEETELRAHELDKVKAYGLYQAQPQGHDAGFGGGAGYDGRHG